MELKSVHFLLTYRCDLECDHCFVWGSPKAKGVFTIRRLRNILEEAKKLGTVDSVSLEGGEPFLYYPIMVKAVKEAVKLGFHVEILSNCYWATCPQDARMWLQSMSRDVELSLSSDLYHGESWRNEEVENAVKAANGLNMKVEVFSIEYPKAKTVCPTEIEGAKVGLYELMYKGRAACELADKAEKKFWRVYTKCPYEELLDPARVHVDPFGFVHVCQGISMGNTWEKPFSKIIGEYDPYEHPVIEPLVRGGPVALVERFGLPHDPVYADACHLCYAARCLLREKYPDILAPDEMYGELE